MDNIMSLTLPHEQKCVHLYYLHVPVLHYISPEMILRLRLQLRLLKILFKFKTILTKCSKEHLWMKKIFIIQMLLVQLSCECRAYYNVGINFTALHRQW